MSMYRVIDGMKVKMFSRILSYTFSHLPEERKMIMRPHDVQKGWLEERRADDPHHPDYFWFDVLILKSSHVPSSSLSFEMMSWIWSETHPFSYLIEFLNSTSITFKDFMRWLEAGKTWKGDEGDTIWGHILQNSWWSDHITIRRIMSEGQNGKEGERVEFSIIISSARIIGPFKTWFVPFSLKFIVLMFSLLNSFA